MKLLDNFYDSCIVHTVGFLSFGALRGPETP